MAGNLLSHVGSQQILLDSQYNSATQRKVLSIISDETHPIHSEFDYFPQGGASGKEKDL